MPRSKNFLIKCIFGLPAMLKISLVLKSNKINNINGNEVIRWIIKKLGFFLFNKKKRGKIENILITI